MHVTSESFPHADSFRKTFLFAKNKTKNGCTPRLSVGVTPHVLACQNENS